MPGCDEPMAPQDSAIIFKKNSNVSNISTSIDLSKKNMRDQPFMKLRDFYIDLNHVKEVEDSILPSKLIFQEINFRKKHGKIKETSNISV